jgi:hypothetical protein
MNWSNLLEPGTLALMIPALVVIGGIVQMILKHRERMAMIEHGMDPRRLDERSMDQRSMDQRSIEKTQSERR